MSAAIAWEDTCVIWRMPETLSDNDILDSREETFRDNRFRHVIALIVDLTPVTSVSVTSATVRHISRSDFDFAPLNPRLQIVIVTASPLLFGLSRMYQQNTKDNTWETHIVADINAAYELIHKQLSTAAKPTEPARSS